MIKTLARYKTGERQKMSHTRSLNHVQKQNSHTIRQHEVNKDGQFKSSVSGSLADLMRSELCESKAYKRFILMLYKKYKVT